MKRQDLSGEVMRRWTSKYGGGRGEPSSSEGERERGSFNFTCVYTSGPLRMLHHFRPLQCDGCLQPVMDSKRGNGLSKVSGKLQAVPNQKNNQTPAVQGCFQKCEPGVYDLNISYVTYVCKIM